jgi:AraC-like DNA-binding protein
MANIPDHVDPLGAALHFLRMSGVFYCRCEFREPWALALPDFEDSMMFHFVTEGRCWLEVDGANASPLRAGDLALVTHGEGHRLVSEHGLAASKLFDIPRQLLSPRYELLQLGGAGASTHVICGVVKFDDPTAHQLIRLLPTLINIDVWDSPEAEWVRSTLRFMAAEARELRAGGETVITRLADILVIQAIRSWIARDPAAQTGWVGALRDEQIGRAVALIHGDPERDWTVATLANAVGMSRSAFAARFTELVGEPVMRYVTQWKMHTAKRWLAQGDLSLGEISSRLGYLSDAAFSRAFKRHAGESPGAMKTKAVKRQARPRGEA